MNAHNLRDNKELFDYLVQLGAELKQSNLAPHGEQVLLASKFSAGSPSEFLHEAQAALQSLIATCGNQLEHNKGAEITSVINQIEKAFRDVGGGVK